MDSYIVIEFRYGKPRSFSIDAKNMDDLRKKLLNEFKGGYMWVYGGFVGHQTSLLGILTWNPVEGKPCWFGTFVTTTPYTVSSKTGKIRKE